MAKNTYDVDEKLQDSYNFKVITRSYKYIKKEKSSLLLALLLNIIAILLSLLAPLFSKIILDRAIPSKLNGFVSDYKLLWIIAVLYLISIIVGAAISYLQSILVTRAGQNIVYELRKDLFEHLQKLSFTYYDDRPHGKILVRVVNYVGNVSAFLSSGLLNLVVQLLSLVFIVFFMLSTNVPLSLIIFSGLPFLGLFLYIIKDKQRYARRELNNKSSNLNAYLNESIIGMKVTQSFTREETNAGIFKKLAKDFNIYWMQTLKYMFSIGPVAEFISNLVLVLLVLFGVLWLDVSIGVLFAMILYAGRFWGPIQALSNIFNELINTTSYLERIYEALDEKIEISDSRNAKDIGDIKGNVEFKNVTFSYDNKINILEDISFKIKQGESIALVGPTGAGKTTIVNLISRFYDINSGDILIDGNSISDITIKSLRKNMGIMLQDPFIFNGTILDNIKYGKLDATLEEVIAAAKAVNADSFINNLQNGYDTEVCERGERLSSGQRQLISFARTLISNPKILILDEATSSIDTETEVILQQGIKTLLNNRTSFIIAHRLSTIKSCNRIFYIADKKIIEEGTHEQLLEKKGYYYKLYTSQTDKI